MLAIMFGSALFRTAVTAGWPVTRLLRVALSLSTICLALAYLTHNVHVLYVLFVIFEGCCGVYFPAIGTLRSELFPEAHRASIMVRRLPA